MAKTKYSAEERAEAVRLSGEIGTTAASERLGIKKDTIYTWVSKAKQQAKKVEALGGPDELAKENEALRQRLKQQAEEIEILQDALRFFVNRRKK